MSLGTGTSAPYFLGSQLALELLDPDSVDFFRLFQSKYPTADWDESPPPTRRARVDPPDPHKDEFCVLYLGSNLPAVAVECQILRWDYNGQYTWASAKAAEMMVARYLFKKPALFMPLDGPNRKILGLEGGQRKLGSYDVFQQVALTLFRKYKTVVHGLSWESMHRDQPGRIYALWHCHKTTIGLETVPADRTYKTLLDDRTWSLYLTENPNIERIDAFSSKQ